MTAHHPLRAAVVAVGVFTVLLLGGCLSIEHDTRYRSLAATDSEEMFNQIVPGRTTRAWLTERLGSPDALWRDAAEHDVLRYDNVREHRTSVSLFPLIDVDVNNEDVERYFFEFADGTLVRYWRATGEGVELMQPQAAPNEAAHTDAAEGKPPVAFATAAPQTAPAPVAVSADTREPAAPAPATAAPAGQPRSEHAPGQRAPAAPAGHAPTPRAPASRAPSANAPSDHAPTAAAPAAQGQLDRGPIERTL